MSFDWGADLDQLKGKSFGVVGGLCGFRFPTIIPLLHMKPSFYRAACSIPLFKSLGGSYASVYWTFSPTIAALFCHLRSTLGSCSQGSLDQVPKIADRPFGRLSLTFDWESKAPSRLAHWWNLEEKLCGRSPAEGLNLYCSSRPYWSRWN